MATVVSGDSTKPSHEEDSSSDSVSNVLVLFAPRHFTLKNIASQIDLLDILIVAGVGYALKTGKLLNWIRKPWDMFKGWIEAGYTGPENELKSMAAMAKMNKDKTFSDFMDSSDSSDEEDDLLQITLAQKKHSRWCLGSHKYSGTPNLKGFKGIGETYIAETYTGLRQGRYRQGSDGALKCRGHHNHKCVCAHNRSNRSGEALQQ
ncbi:hypothetical protein OROHE_025824 [Orobanche hederae]